MTGLRDIQLSSNLQNSSKDEDKPECIQNPVAESLVVPTNTAKNRRIGKCNDGLYQISTRNTDTVGNVGDWITRTIERDTVSPAKPTINLVKTGDILKETASVSIVGEGNSKANLELVITNDIGESHTSKLINNIDVNGKLDLGTLWGKLSCGGYKYSISVSLEDRAGNISQIETKEITTLACPVCPQYDQIELATDGSTEKANISYKGWVSPVSGVTSSGYGNRTFRGVTEFHRGLDFAAPAGTSALATRDATVSSKGFQTGGYGNFVVLKLDNGIYAVYGHLQNAVSLNVGSSVTAGQIVGKVGSTGLSTGNHLHFQLQSVPSARAITNHINPKPFLEGHSGSVTVSSNSQYKVVQTTEGNLTAEQQTRFGCKTAPSLKAEVIPDAPITGETGTTTSGSGVSYAGSDGEGENPLLIAKAYDKMLDVGISCVDKTVKKFVLDDIAANKTPRQLWEYNAEQEYQRIAKVLGIMCFNLSFLGTQEGKAIPQHLESYKSSLVQRAINVQEITYYNHGYIKCDQGITYDQCYLRHGIIRVAEQVSNWWEANKKTIIDVGITAIAVGAGISCEAIFTAISGPFGIAVGALICEGASLAVITILKALLYYLNDIPIEFWDFGLGVIIDALSLIGVGIVLPIAVKGVPHLWNASKKTLIAKGQAGYDDLSKFIGKKIDEVVRFCQKVSSNNLNWWEVSASAESGCGFASLMKGLSSTTTNWLTKEGAETFVYVAKRDGKVVYVGISDDIARRQLEHVTSGKIFDGDKLYNINDSLRGMTPHQARAVEQVLIEKYGLENLDNKINSIAIARDIHDEAVQFGNKALEQYPLMHK